MKDKIRQEMRTQRKAVDHAYRINSSLQLLKQFQSIGYHEKCQNVAIYYPFDGEINSYPIIIFLLQFGKNIFLPKESISENRLVFYSLKDSTACIPDLLLVPVVAFDAHCNRLGFGKGWYDKTIAFLKNDNSALEVCGLAYEFQCLTSIPIDEWDQPMDAVITEKTVRKRQ